MEEKQEDARVKKVAEALAQADGKHFLVDEGGDPRHKEVHFAPYKREAARFLAAFDAAAAGQKKQPTRTKPQYF